MKDIQLKLQYIAAKKLKKIFLEMFIINIVKMSILQIKKKILNDFFFLFVCVCESRKPHPKIHVESQETSDNQDNLVKEEQTFRIHTF